MRNRINFIVVLMLIASSFYAQQQLEIEMTDGRVYTKESGLNGYHLGLILDSGIDDGSRSFLKFNHDEIEQAMMYSIYDQTTSTANLIFRTMNSNADLIFMPNSIEQMRINADDGSVIVNTSLETPYLAPGFKSTSLGYEFIRFGTPTTSYAGFMWNDTNPTFGDGDDFTIFTYSNRDIAFKPNGTGNSYFYTGNVGIGTTNPLGYKLAVKGNIGAEEIEVRTNYWADFVFKEDYQLRSLKDVESFIKKNGHLPEIPSTEEAISTPLNLGAMDVKLLQKVEELTLYTIEQEKTIQRQQKLIEQQAQLFQMMEKRLQKLEEKE